jgi:hypothetical protein
MNVALGGSSNDGSLLVSSDCAGGYQPLDSFIILSPFALPVWVRALEIGDNALCGVALLWRLVFAVVTGSLAGNQRLVAIHVNWRRHLLGRGHKRYATRFFGLCYRYGRQWLDCSSTAIRRRLVSTSVGAGRDLWQQKFVGRSWLVGLNRLCSLPPLVALGLYTWLSLGVVVARIAWRLWRDGIGGGDLAVAVAPHPLSKLDC